MSTMTARTRTVVASPWVVLGAVVLGAVVLGAPEIAAQDRPAPPPAAETRPAAPTAATPTIEEGSTVRIEYTLKDTAGAVLDSTKEREPLRYTQGQQQILPGLEKELKGLHAGQEKKVTLGPEEAYGAVDPAAQTEVPKTMLPEGTLVVGTRLLARNPAGQARQVTVKEVKDASVVLDLNHPLAGKTLVFELKVVDVVPPGAPGPAAPAPAAPAPAAPAPPAAPSR
ncbi:MAG: peptidylprolyl isomerase [Candidatus Rokuibacteriota bacterium]